MKAKPLTQRAHETRSSVNLQSTLLNVHDAMLAENVNRLEAASQVINERSSVIRQSTLLNAIMYK
jgi:hypothetical protein